MHRFANFAPTTWSGPERNAAGEMVVPAWWFRQVAALLNKTFVCFVLSGVSLVNTICRTAPSLASGHSPHLRVRELASERSRML